MNLKMQCSEEVSDGISDFLEDARLRGALLAEKKVMDGTIFVEIKTYVSGYMQGRRDYLVGK